ncbi:MAG TPA: multicopper oxidase family protein [Bryobacteraceae bacterium]|jgi:FtsP/CotA-like multicopper oxidase with cupredoxin domain|nr:multicopper oxidase family protein [Bryobacteraceae bacterium]
MNFEKHCKLIVIFVTLLKSAEICPRPSGGSTVTPPADVRTSNGRLETSFAFRSEVDDYGLTRYCYVSEKGGEAPTLRVRPGDEVVLTIKNELMTLPHGSPVEHKHAPHACSGGPMTSVSTNLHFHGLEIPPTCHQDDVIHTSIQPSDPAFQYRFRIPAGQPPGLYWYHPHPHGYSERQVLGGASGALIVEGIRNFKPQVADLPERVLILRDQRMLGPSGDRDDTSGKDISLNFVPIMFPLYMPAVMRVKADQREFWRVLNASADTYFSLQVITVDNERRVAQDMQLIAMDGVPLADDIRRTEILVSPGSRAEFILTTPHEGAFSQFVSRSYDTGPDGSANPDRVLANIVSGNSIPEAHSVDEAGAAEWHFTDLRSEHPAAVRRLYFSEDREDLRSPGKPARYFITVEGRTPALFDMNFKRPDITVRQGSVEDWIIENRAREGHVFHIHQLHFQLLARDAVEMDQPSLLDTIDLPYWDGKSARYPSVKLRMDFRAREIVGTFLFHCHILEHEDAGMMGSVEVVRRR